MVCRSRLVLRQSQDNVWEHGLALPQHQRGMSDCQDFTRDGEKCGLGWIPSENQESS